MLEAVRLIEAEVTVEEVVERLMRGLETTRFISVRKRVGVITR